MARLPEWARSAEVAWPPYRPLDPAAFTPVVGGDPRLCSDRWWEVREEEALAR